MNKVSFFAMIVQWCKARGREFWAEDTSPREPLRDVDREKEWRASQSKALAHGIGMYGCRFRVCVFTCWLLAVLQYGIFAKTR